MSDHYRCVNVKEYAARCGLASRTARWRLAQRLADRNGNGAALVHEVAIQGGLEKHYHESLLTSEERERFFALTREVDTREPATTPEAGSSRAHQGGSASPGPPTANAAALVPLPLFDIALPEAMEKQLGTIPGAEKQRQALVRFRAVEPFTKNGTWRKLCGQFVPGIGKVQTKQDAIVWVARQNKIGARTLARWVKRFRADGLAGLADKARKDEGRTSLTLEQQRHLLKLYDAPEKRKVKECIELLHLEIDVGMLPGPKPSYSACKRFLKRHNPQIIADLSREGDKYFYDHHEPYAVRDLSGIPPNFWWVADFRQVDVRDRDANERPGREWMCVIQDISSGAWIGWTYAPHPSTQLFKSALRMAIQNWGVPGRWLEDGSWESGHLSLDNGKEFIAKDAVGKIRRFWLPYTQDEDLIGFLEVLGLKYPEHLHLCLPYNARGKSWLESSFNLFSRFERRLPGATGNRPHNRPEKLKKEEERHSAFLSGRLPDSPLLKREERRKRTDQFIEVYNWQRRHPERKHIPGQALARVKRSPKPDEAALDILLWYRRRVKAQGDKVSVYFNSVRRTFADDRLLIASGEYVQVHCDPANPDRAIVFQHGKLLCRPRALIPLPQGATQEQLKELGQRQRRLRKQLKSSVKEMREGVHTLDEARAVEILAVRAEENRRALTTGIKPSPRLALPGYDEAAGMLAEEEPPTQDGGVGEDDHVALPNYGKGTDQVFSSHTEAKKCKQRESRKNGS